MPSIREMNESHPFWEWVAQMQEQGHNFPYAAPPNRSTWNEATPSPWETFWTPFGPMPYRGPHQAQTQGASATPAAENNANAAEAESTRAETIMEDTPAPAYSEKFDEKYDEKSGEPADPPETAPEEPPTNPPGTGEPPRHPHHRHGRHGHHGPHGPHGVHGPQGVHGPHGVHGRRGGCGMGGRGGRGYGPFTWGGPSRGRGPFGGGRPGAVPHESPFPFDLNNIAESFMPFLQGLGDRTRGFGNFTAPPFFADAATSAQNAATNKRSDGTFRPPIDVFDTPSAYIIHASLPGAKKADLDVSWDAANAAVKISGVVARPAEVDEEMVSTLALDERQIGLFEREVKLGTSEEARNGGLRVDVEGITARLEDGVLRIEVPKEATEEWTEVRKVDVE